MSNPRLDKFYRDIYGERLSIRKAYDLPPLFFKCNRGGNVFAALGGDVMRCPIHFDEYIFPVKGEVHYSPETREWVLGSIRFTEKGYFALKGGLCTSPLLVHEEPVTEEGHAISEEWGPVVP
jgi:hypothetical protein